MSNQKIEISWVEAVRASGRISQIEAANLTGIKSLGYIIKEDELSYFIAQSLLPGYLENLILIPRSSVIEIKFWKEEEAIEQPNTYTSSGDRSGDRSQEDPDGSTYRSVLDIA